MMIVESRQVVEPAACGGAGGAAGESGVGVRVVPAHPSKRTRRMGHAAKRGVHRRVYLVSDNIQVSSAPSNARQLCNSSSPVFLKGEFCASPQSQVLQSRPAWVSNARNPSGTTWLLIGMKRCTFGIPVSAWMTGETGLLGGRSLLQPQQKDKASIVSAALNERIELLTRIGMASNSLSLHAYVV